MTDTPKPVLDIMILNQSWERPELREWLMAVMREAHESGLYNVMAGSANARPVTENRNRICQAFLERGPEHQVLMMIDHDMHPLQTPWSLFAAMLDPDGGIDIVSYVMPAWKPNKENTNPLMWVAMDLDENGLFTQRAVDLNGNGLIEVDATGSGVMLIARRVLEHPKMRAPFMDQFNRDGRRKMGHDFSFCLRARRQGFRVWISRDHYAGHQRLIELLDVAKLVGSYEDRLRLLETQISMFGVEPASDLVALAEIMGEDCRVKQEMA